MDPVNSEVPSSSRFCQDWRWRVAADNGKIIGASTEGYRNKAAAVANFSQLTGRRVASNEAVSTLTAAAADPGWQVLGL